jgi:hypothetical protein
VVTTRSAPAPSSISVVQAGHAERGHAGRLGGLDAAGRILGDEAVGRGDAELLRRGEEDRRIRLALGEVPAGDVRVEDLGEGHARGDELVVDPLLGGEQVQADPVEEQLGVLRRRRRRHRDA